MSAGVAEVSPKYLAEAVSNAVPLGYKQTDVGVIPDDWDVSPLSRMTSLMTNGFVGTAKTHYTDSHDGITYIQGYNVEENGFNFNGIKRVTPEFHKKNSKSCLREGDVLMVQTGDVGLVTIVPQELEGANCHALIISRFKKETYDPQYFSYYLNSQQGRLRLKELETGTTMKHINVGDLLHFEVPYPRAQKEQTAIANALSDVDALISELEKLIAKKQAIKTATMQQLLTGRTRLPQFALREDGTPKGTKPSELGEIPEDWEVGFVGDVCDMLTGFPFPSSKYSDSGVRLLRGSNVKRSCTDWSAEITQYWPELTSSIAQYELKIGDIVISMDGSLVGRSFAQLRESDLPAVLLQRVARLRSEAVSQSYLKEWVCSKFFTEHCDSVKTVTAIPHISPQDIRSFKLLLPPSKEEQTAIAIILSDMDAEIQALEQRLGKTRQIKQGMMQELLTGKTRLIKGEAHG